MINPYAAMYDAVMTVWRWRDVQTGGYDKQELYTVEEGVPCRYSTSGQISTGTPNPSIVNSHTLFCGLDVDIQEGDRVTVQLRTGKILELSVGECHPYTYQWQCEVKRDDDA